MYYEESLINGVLHWRSTPKGGWVEKTPQQLTDMLLEARREKQRFVTAPAPMFVRPPYEVTCG